MWLFSPKAHAFLRVVKDGTVAASIDAEGFAHACVTLKDGGLAWVDLTRRKVLAMDSRGRVVHETGLPPGLRDVRRIVVSGNGTLMLHTAFQETFVVPAESGAGLREWFASKHDGLVFPGMPGLASRIVAKDGVVELRTSVAPERPATGDLPDRRFRLVSGEGVLAADVVGCDPGGWWIRVTLGRPGEARDRLVRVSREGAKVAVWNLQGPGTLSFSGTFFPDDRALTRLVPTDDGVVVEKWSAG